MSTPQTVSFQEALDIVESLPEDQQETLVAVVRHRLVEHTRDVLSKHIEEAREELSRGDVRRGTVDDLIHEIGPVVSDPEPMAFLAGRSREKDRLGLDEGERALGL